MKEFSKVRETRIVETRGSLGVGAKQPELILYFPKLVVMSRKSICMPQERDTHTASAKKKDTSTYSDGVSRKVTASGCLPNPGSGLHTSLLSEQ